MNKKLIFRILIAVVVGVLIFGGIVLIWKSAGWMPAVGSFMIIWGHNLEMHRKKKEEVVTKISPKMGLDMIAQLCKGTKDETKN